MLTILSGIVAGTMPDFKTIRCPFSPATKAVKPVPSKTQKAIQEIEQAIAASPTDASLFYYAGYIKLKVNNKSAALDSFEKGIKLNEKEPLNYVGKAQVNLLDGKPADEIDRKVSELLEKLGLSSRRHHRPDAMSGGEQQRVAIGRALIADPAVILADEPTGNLDSANSKAVCELLRDLTVTGNRTIVMVTHEPTVAAYAREVAVLKDGRLCDRFAVTDVNDGPGVAMRYQEAVGRERGR